jgi:hypothetical protein
MSYFDELEEESLARNKVRNPKPRSKAQNKASRLKGQKWLEDFKKRMTQQLTRAQAKKEHR